MNSLKVKMIIPFSVLFIGFSLLLGYLIFQSSYNMVIDSLSEQSHRIAESVSKKIDIQQYEQMIQSETETSYYFALREQFNEIREMNGLKYLYTMGKETNGDEEIYFYVVDGLSLDAEDGSDFREIEEDAVTEYPNIIEAFQTGEMIQGELTDTEEYGATLTTYIPFHGSDGSVIGIIGIDFEADNIYELLSDNKRNMFLLTVGISIVGFIVIFIYASLLTRPLQKLTDKVQTVSNGDLTVKVDIHSKDEIGKLSTAFAHMVEDLRMIISEINETTEKLSESSTEFSEGAITSKDTAKQVTQSMKETALGTTTQTEKAKIILQLMNHSMEHLNNGRIQIDRTVENANHSTYYATEGKDHLENAINHLTNITGTINEATDSIQSLSKRSDEVEGIITIISEISEQTNLLALNAAIEAARAGEHGKGFSVVASEVKKLAEQSATAAQGIIELIGAIQNETTLTVKTMEQTRQAVEKQVQAIQDGGKSLEKIVDNVIRTETDTKDLQMVFRTLDRDIQVVKEEITNISDVIEQTAMITDEVVSSVEEQTKSIDIMAENTLYLSNLSEKLKQQVSKFKV